MCAGLLRPPRAQYFPARVAAGRPTAARAGAPDAAAVAVRGRRTGDRAGLLGRREVRRVILCGQVTEQCVLYSALDAHIRHIGVGVAPEALAPIDAGLADAALRMRERNMSARVCSLDALTFNDPDE
nr:isochorismatase family protein [Streptomyces sp. DH8]